MTLAVQIWSDIACPWCYVGKRRLEAALARFAHRDAVEVRWRAFELDPTAPREADRSVGYAERLATKYRTSVERAEDMIRAMTATAAADGLDLRFDLVRPGNTFDAHRLVHLASERGLGDAVKERLLRGYLCEGAAIGDPTALAALATDAGLDAAEVEATLASDAHAAAVRQDEREAAALGIHGVPFFVIGRYGVSGAQPADALLGVLSRAWAELVPAPLEPAGVAGAACGPDGCGG